MLELPNVLFNDVLYLSKKFFSGCLIRTKVYFSMIFVDVSGGGGEARANANANAYAGAGSGGWSLPQGGYGASNPVALQ